MREPKSVADTLSRVKRRPPPSFLKESIFNVIGLVCFVAVFRVLPPPGTASNVKLPARIAEKRVGMTVVVSGTPRRMPSSNPLYLAVLPLIHVSPNTALGFGLTEQVLTLFPERKFATEFFEDEVDGYIATFENRTKHLTGGHVKSWQIDKELVGNGRVIVRVIQHVE